MTIEGIPDGWELVRVGVPDSEDWLIGHDGSPVSHAALKRPLKLRQYAIIRKIEKPKQYRPFANAAEFEPHRDRWVRESGCSHAYAKVVYYDNTSAHIDCQYDSWESYFRGYTFDDGTPFGIEVTE